VSLTKDNELHWLASRVRPFLRLHLGSYGFIVLASVLTLLDPLIVGYLIDEVIPNGRVTWLPLVGFAFILI
jgi:ABC-type bacteriocin/lantibiotic exporter with double-glycine peptidase domain